MTKYLTEYTQALRHMQGKPDRPSPKVLQEVDPLTLGVGYLAYKGIKKLRQARSDHLSQKASDDYNKYISSLSRKEMDRSKRIQRKRTLRKVGNVARLTGKGAAVVGKYAAKGAVAAGKAAAPHVQKAAQKVGQAASKVTKPVANYAAKTASNASLKARIAGAQVSSAAKFAGKGAAAGAYLAKKAIKTGAQSAAGAVGQKIKSAAQKARQYLARRKAPLPKRRVNLLGKP